MNVHGTWAAKLFRCFALEFVSTGAKVMQVKKSNIHLSGKRPMDPEIRKRP